MVFLFVGCQQSKHFKTADELIMYIQDEQHGYSQQKTINGVAYTLLYRPTDLLVNQELSSVSASATEVEALRQKYKNYLYFNLSMSKNNQELLSVAPKNQNEFGAMVSQLAFGMNEKVHLFTQQKDTIALADYIYPRMYGMSRATTMMFVYPRDPNNLDQDYLNFTIEDLGLYTGEVKFKIDPKVLKNEPQLKF
ncbi:hypothetical protein N8216_02045 [Flavobacteriaceae bacterium]|nr:hypothetical protein [Flavobacteriaceae bacterium]